MCIAHLIYLYIGVDVKSPLSHVMRRNAVRRSIINVYLNEREDQERITYTGSYARTRR